MSEYPSIGAFYQCYKRPKAVISVISSFRKYYPDSDMYVVGDGGDDFSKLAEHFNVRYKNESFNTGNGVSNVFENPDRLISWLHRLVDAAKYIKEDYILLLEDDVLVMDVVRQQLPFTINGNNPAMQLGRNETKFLKKRNKSIPFWTRNYYWGGFGGCIVKKSFILEHFTDVEGDIEKIRPHVHWDKFVSDIWISLLVLYHGGTIGPFKGLCETWYVDFDKRKNELHDISILHQYKDLYETPIDEEDKKLLGFTS